MMVLPSKLVHLKVSPEHLTTGMLRLTKSQDSAYLLSKMVPLREVDAAISDRNYAMLRNWLNGCISTHDRCRRSVSGYTFNDGEDGESLPTRVRYVGSLNHTCMPWLLETRGLRGRYITLSYRWARGLNIYTTREKLLEYKKALPLELVPQIVHKEVVVSEAKCYSQCRRQGSGRRPSTLSER